MKKIFLILAVLLFSGCVDGNRDFETICTKREESKGFVVNKTNKIYFNSDNDITKIIEIYNLNYIDEEGSQAFLASKKSLDSYSKTKKYEVKITKDLENVYEIELILDISKISEEELENYGIKKNYYDQIKTYKNDMKCD